MDKEIQELKERILQLESKMDVLIKNQNLSKRSFFQDTIVSFIVVFLAVIISAYIIGLFGMNFK